MPLDLTTQNIIISSIFGLIGGGIISIIAPWTHWGIEKKRKKLEGRKKIIDDCKAYFKKNTFFLSMFLKTSFYSNLRPYFSKVLVARLESEKIQLRAGRGRHSGTNNFRAEILDELAKIEKEWGLV